VGHFVDLTWEPPAADGVPYRFRRSGPYRAFVPDPLASHAVTLPNAVTRVAAEAEAAVAAASVRLKASAVGTVTDLAARSEAARSSQIEGYLPSARRVALADFLGRGRTQAVVVARDLRLVRESAGLNVPPAELLKSILDLQARLLPPRLAGIRQVPVWIGGASPLYATYVAPPADLVPALLEDLGRYIAAETAHPITTAAIAHAQFEAIHPFADGNGRVGRILLGGILRADGLVPPGVTLPVSAFLHREGGRYYAALEAWHADPQDAAPIVGLVANAVIAAATSVDALAHDVGQLRAALLVRLREHAQSAGRRYRSGSLASRLVSDFATSPVADAAFVAKTYGVTASAAKAALDALADAGVVKRDTKSDRTRVCYVFTELLDLIDAIGDDAEPSRIDDDPETTIQADGSAAAAALDTAPDVAAPLCGHWLPRAHRTCRLPAGHRGQHR
jgi:Fic family protein